MKFSIGFDKRDLPKLNDYWNDIIDRQQWSEGIYTQLFEEKWAEYNELRSVAFSSWTGAALAAMRYFNLEGKTVLCPANTFMATPLVILNAGAKVEFVDCNREDLCLSYDDFIVKAESHKPAAVWVVHIGGHIAFDIKAFCKIFN